MTRETIKHEGHRQHLTAIIGAELSAVTFVRDYVQLHFDGSMISAYTLPIVVIGASVISPADCGYRDALCARIGTAVRAAYADPGEHLKIELSDGSSIAISLRHEEHVVEEAAVYTDAQTNEWASW